MLDGTPTLGRLVESFFRDTLATQRRASPRTVASYRDALKLFLVFVSKQEGRPPSSLTVADLDANAVVTFLNHPVAVAGQADEHPARVCVPVGHAGRVFPRITRDRSGILNNSLQLRR